MTPALGDWLRAYDLAELEATFVDNEVDLKTLKILTDSDLKELGLAFGPRKRILAAIAKLRLELPIREQLNAAWAGVRGWAAEEIGTNTERILRLAWGQGNAQRLILGRWWLWTNTITQGRIADSLPLAQSLLDEGEETPDEDLKIFGPAAAMVSHFLLGQLTEESLHAERVLALYDPGARSGSWELRSTLTLAHLLTRDR